MFKYACFINKNTEELRKKLSSLGYEYGGKDRDSLGHSALFTTNGKFYEVYPAKPTRDYKIIDCKENEELFLAIACIRTDTSLNQWFVCDKKKPGAIGLNYIGQWFKWIINKDINYINNLKNIIKK